MGIPGTAKSIDVIDFANSYVGTAMFIAPEVGSERYNLKADIFSLGIVSK